MIKTILKRILPTPLKKILKKMIKAKRRKNKSNIYKKENTVIQPIKDQKTLETPQLVELNITNKKELKIGILSINAYIFSLNLACPLHSLVFSDVLTDLGFNNVIVNYYPLFYPKTKANIKFPLLEALKNKDSDQKKDRVEEWTNLFYDRIERYDKFKSFVDKRYKFTKYGYDIDLLDRISNAEDINCFVAVTDTIWNYDKRLGFDKGFFLACRAMENSYKFSYAASRGSSNYEKPEEEEAFLNYIKNINDISVREKSFQNYIKSKTDIPVAMVVDPVFLKNKSYYYSLLISPNKTKQNYVLLYLVNQDDDDLLLITLKYAIRNNLDLIELSERPSHRQKTGYSRHSVMYNVSVEEWLGYINNAEFIFTNSFHGCCLSIILEKQFFVGNRGDKVDNVIEIFNLSCRKIDKAFNENADMIVDTIDYTKVNLIKDDLVKKSMDFLTRSLKKAEEHVCEHKIIPHGYLTTGDKYECHGCAACEKVCSKNAITMNQDKEGFYFPHVNQEKCIKCGMCVNACSYNNRKSLYFTPLEVYLAYNRKPEERANSSSGGMFSAMADYFLNSGGAVVGVRFNEKWEALYDIAETHEDSLKFKYSKYVEAMDNDIYIKTKAKLENGKKVLFTGTPCKISGLLNYLNKDY
jgi:ferredoxin